MKTKIKRTESHSDFQLSDEPLQRLRECLGNAEVLRQEAVGNAPRRYLDELANLAGTKGMLPNGFDVRERLDRESVVKVVRSEEVDVLQAYAVTMAWGGRNFRNFRLTLGKNSIQSLRKLLEDLRMSRKSRESDFERAQKACKRIKGLGISFHSKLLFFLRATQDAYILDQWTAKSVNLLFANCPIRLTSQGMPHPGTTAQEYVWFCEALEFLGRQFKTALSGDQVEQVLFDRPGGCWRSHVKNHLDSVNPVRPRRKKPNAAKSKGKATGGAGPDWTDHRHRLAEVIACHHNREQARGIQLPGDQVVAGRSTPVRILCGSRRGVSWQYDIQQKSVHAKVFVPKAMREEVLPILLDAHGHEIDVRSGKTGSARLTVHRGAKNPEVEWPGIAEESVAAMNQLFELLGELV
jgi:hypothetical protein